MYFILASQSPQRAKLVKSLPYDWQIMPANIDEAAIDSKNPRDKAQKIALAKAEAILAKTKGDAIIIAADTFSICQGKILEKPKTKAEAREMLQWQSAKKTKSLTGYAFFYRTGEKIIKQTGVVAVKAKFRQLDAVEIEAYIANNPVLTWSAAFSAAYDVGMALISEINGNLTALTHGLPIDLVADFIKRKLQTSPQ